MQDLPADSVLRRLNYTPLSDLLRGRITARWDVCREIATANLPETAARLVYTVTRRTRLWRREQLDVARELAGHFCDGLEAGQSAECLVKDFGDLRQAAILIRRARRRARPRWWQVLHRTAQAIFLLFAMVLVWFGWSAAKFWLGRPAIAHDFVAEINAPALAVPQPDRAWPLYRDAALALQTAQKEVELFDFLAFRSEPTDLTWQQMLDHLRKNKQTLQLTRQGAARPRFGFVFGDSADAAFMQAKVNRDSAAPRPDECLIQVLLPHMQEMRGLARLLAMDARRATVEKDAVALQANLRAMIGLAGHVWDSESFLIGDLVSLACYQIAIDQIGRSLADRPELFTESDLRDLSHLVAAFADGQDIRLRMGGEKMMMLDVFQRMYSDDGAGDGQLTADGYRFLQAFMPLTSLSGSGNPSPWYEQHLLGPAACGLIAGRAEMTELMLRLFDRLEAEQQGPVYSWQPSQVEDELHDMASGTTGKIRYLPILLLFPAVQQARFAGELACQRRDGLLAAIALELSHRRTGTWPPALKDLTPALSPRVPMDRFTGQPLGYKIVDGRPLLYSCGADGQDDGGIPPLGEDRERANQQAGIIGNPTRGRLPLARYDWLLWPPAPLREPTTDDLKAFEPAE